MPKQKRKHRTPAERIAALEAEIERLRAKMSGEDRFSPEAVEAERVRLGLTARQYGDLVGVSVGTVNGWENGRTVPSKRLLKMWLAVKGITKTEAHARLGIEEASSRGFSPEAVAAERKRLGMSAKQYGALVGVSHLTIYSWEHGRTKPRAEQLEKWLAVKGIGKGEAGVDPVADSGFSPEAVAAERERLGISAARYAQLLDVSALTIYLWEKKRTKPRAALLQKWLDVRGISKRDALKSLGIKEPSLRGFSAKAVRAERERLELSAADYAELIGVSMLTVYNWEKGRSKPQVPQLEKWKAVKGIGKREAWRRLGYL